jgi:hypothetical protein
MITISSVTIGLTAANPFINLHANKEMYSTPKILFTQQFHTPRSRTDQEQVKKAPSKQLINLPPKRKFLPSERERKNHQNEKLRTRKNPSAFPSNPQRYGGVKNPTPPPLSRHA